MRENRTNGGPSVGLLLLIPAVVVVAKMAKHHHRMMWDDVDPEAATPYRWHGRHRFAGPEAPAAAREGVRLPPRIEWILDTWHTRAHQADQPAEAPSA